MNIMEQQLKKLILDNAVELFGTTLQEQAIQIQQTRKEVAGDITLVLFPFIKLLKVKPEEVADKLGNFILNHIPAITSFELVSGFLNFTISDEYWVAQFKSSSQVNYFGYAEAESKPTVMVEYSSPNTNKPLHLGHLRNNFLGYSVAEILKANGHKVVKTQVINDRGIHICKSMLAWQKFSPVSANGERETPQNTGLKGDKLVGKYYVEFDKQFNAEAAQLISRWEEGDFEAENESIKEEFLKLQEALVGKDEKAQQAIRGKIKDLAKNQTELLREAKDMLVKWEARDPQTYLLWSTMNGWVYAGFDETYQAMGVDFDKLYYESDTFLLGKDIILDGLQKGVFFKKDDGSIWIDLTAEGLDEKLVLRADGTAVYITQDIGTAVDRFKDYPDLDGIIYTVGNEQDYHFKVLFLILEKMGYSWAEKCAHLSYGMVDLPSGRMKSREGTVVDADDLMQDVIEKAAEMTRERGHLEGMSENQKADLFKLIGMGGLKYYLLKVDPKKRMMFNPEESIELNGNTGPFIQYAHARIKSLLAKAGGFDWKVDHSISLREEEREIIKLILQFPDVIREAGLLLSPAVIANYSYELVKAYNHFYQVVSILNESDVHTKSFRLALSEMVAKLIQSSTQLLGIHVPERM